VRRSSTSGPIRQIVQGSTATPRRFLAAAEVVNGAPGRIVQVQRDDMDPLAAAIEPLIPGSGRYARSWLRDRAMADDVV
jgi:hypothetical protein